MKRWRKKRSLTTSYNGRHLAANMTGHGFGSAVGVGGGTGALLKSARRQVKRVQTNLDNVVRIDGWIDGMATFVCSQVNAKVVTAAFALIVEQQAVAGIAALRIKRHPPGFDKTARILKADRVSMITVRLRHIAARVATAVVSCGISDPM